MIRHFKDKIQNEIQKELFNAKQSIHIAVAWFTNDLLFQPLLLKLRLGVDVELILNHDEINVSENNDIDFDSFIEAGGKLHWNKSYQLMHEKFCIIDNRIVISGSYNWTNKAEINNESISIFYDEDETVAFYAEEFSQLCSKYSLESKGTTKDQPDKLVSTQEAQSVEKQVQIIDTPIEPNFIAQGPCPGGGEFCLKKGKQAPSIIWRTVDDGWLFINGNTGVFCENEKRPWDEYSNQIKHIEFKDGVIGDYAFSNMSNLLSVQLYRCSKICSNAFENCPKLSSIYFSNTVEWIGVSAFKNCVSLKHSRIRAKIIDNYAFYGCISIPGIRVKDDEFRYESNEYKKKHHFELNPIKPIYIEPDRNTKQGFITWDQISDHEYEQRVINAKENFSKSIDFYNKHDVSIMEKAENELSKIEYRENDYLVLENVEAIGEYTFGNCTGILNISLPNTVNLIAYYAFNGCSSLKELWLPDNIRLSMDDNVVAGCDALETIRVPSFFSKYKDVLRDKSDKAKLFMPSELKEYPLIPGQNDGRPIEFISMVDIPDNIFGSHYDLQPDDIVEFVNDPLIVRSPISVGSSKYSIYVSVIRNGCKGWLNLKELVKCDRNNIPICEFRAKMLSFPTWRERFMFLHGMKIKGGSFDSRIKYEAIVYSNGIPTNETKVRTATVIEIIS